MGKLRLDINSTDVLGTYGIVNIVFNDINLATSKQLSATVESLEYDVDILTPSNNVLKIALLNDRAYNTSGRDDFRGDGDQTLIAVVSSLSYSIDDVNFTTLLPQTATSYTIPSGIYAGNIVTLTESVSEFQSYGKNYTLSFNSDGIINTDQVSGVKFKVLENGNVQDLINNVTYDSDGNIV